MLSTTVSTMTLWQEISKCLVELSTAVGDVDRRFERISGKFGGRLMLSLANSSITLLINVASWLVDVGKISSDRAACRLNSQCLQNSNLAVFMVLRFLCPWIGGCLWLSATFLWFEGLLYWKKLIFSLRVVLGHQSIWALGPRPITRPLSLPLCMSAFGAFFSFFSLLWGRGIFHSRPGWQFSSLPHWG